MKNQIIAPAEGKIHVVSVHIKGEASREIVLLNFPDRYVGSERPLTWGEQQRLHPIAAPMCFEIGEYVPDLNRDIGVPFMVVVALDPQRQKAHGVQWKLSERKVIFPSFNGVFNSEAWFAFERDAAL